jgi:DNA-binding transcriptional MerR regulator
MAKKPSLYTVKQLALLSSVSVRTLHYYDAIGLLKPAHVGDNSYRYYGREELLRLQDILFHRELGMPLSEIAHVMANRAEDRLATLQRHRQTIAVRVERSHDLLRTIDRTIAKMQGKDEMSDKDLYHGFAPEKQAQYEEDLIEMLGEDAREGIATSKAHLGKLGKEGMAAALVQGKQAERALAVPFAGGVSAVVEELEPLFEAHRAWVEHMWGKECPHRAYGGLADLYLSHPDFRAHFDAHGEGFTDWIAEGMKAYAERSAA